MRDLPVTVEQTFARPTQRAQPGVIPAYRRSNIVSRSSLAVLRWSGEGGEPVTWAASSASRLRNQSSSRSALPITLARQRPWMGEEAGLERVRRWRSQAIGEDIDRQLDADDEWPESPQAG